jgi:hypothetical protein
MSGHSCCTLARNLDFHDSQRNFFHRILREVRDPLPEFLTSPAESLTLSVDLLNRIGRIH